MLHAPLLVLTATSLFLAGAPLATAGVSDAAPGGSTAAISGDARAPTEHGRVVYVRGETDFEAVVDASDASGTPLPFASLSERVPRPARTPRGVGLRLLGAPADAAITAPQLFVVRHATNERVVRGADRALWIVGDERLPVSATRPGSSDEELPWIARTDANGIGGRLRLVLGAVAPTDRLVFTACEATAGAPGSSVTVVAGAARTTLALRGRATDAAITPETFALTGEVEITIEGPGLVDQISIARARLHETRGDSALALRETTTTAGRVTGRASRRGEGPAWPEFTADRDASAASDGESAREWWFVAPPMPAANEAITLRLEFPSSTTELATEPRNEQARVGWFRDVAREAGVAMVHMEGPALQLDIRPTMGPGAAWGDVDGDGWVDLFLPQGAGREGSNVPTSRLYKNRGDGTFVDVSVASGLALRGAGMGALFFDADGDLDLDLFVANFGRNRFLLNDGHGKFTDQSEAVGLSTDRWHSAVSAADYDRDGDLDLYVSSYLLYDESKMPLLEDVDPYRREDPVAMLPYAFPGETKSLMRNDRLATTEASTAPKPLFRFTDVAKETGLDDPAGRGMQALFWDFDRDGDPDLYVANDVSPNRFWRNEGGGKWKDIGFSTGVDDPRGSMGLSAGDVDGDGDEDLFVTNWQLESNALYLNNLLSNTSAKRHVATFRDCAVQAGLAQLSVGVTGWGCELADFDLDGDLDLAYANGYTSPDYEGTGICVGQPSHFFENDGEGRFTPAFDRAGPELALPLSSRAFAACDYDQDGDLDVVVTANNGRVRLLRNELVHGRRHWLGVRLRGRGGNTFAIGAEVSVSVGGRTLRRTMHAGTGYLTGNAPELHFGLGDASTIASVVVRWPDGTESTLEAPAVDRFVTITER